MRIGSYDVEGEIGRGGMGVVLRARSRDGEVVAIKVVHRVEAGRALARFEREGRLLAELGEADGFVPLRERGDSPQGPFLVMPFLPGGTLADRIRKGALPVEETVAIATALAAALGRAHARGIIHRDMKPANVIFTADGRPLVADLGLAKHWTKDAPGASCSVDLSKTGTARGTVGYMAPEQILDAKTVGPPADVFALGAIIFECLAGVPPFAGETALAVFAQITGNVRTPLGDVRPDTPPWLMQLVDRALAHEPDARFADGAAVVAALGARRARSRAPLVALATLPLLAIGLLLAVLLRSPETAAPPPPQPASPVAELASVLPGVPATKHLRVARVLSNPAWSTCGATQLAWLPGRARAQGDRREHRGEILAASEECLWLVDATSGALLRLMEGHVGDIHALAVSPDGRLAASASLGRPPAPGGRYQPEPGKPAHVRLWDLEKGTTVRTLADGRFTALAFVPDGKRVLAGAEDGTIHVLDVATGKETSAFKASKDGIRRIAIWNERMLVSSSTLTLFDIESQQRVTEVHADVGPVSLIWDGHRALTAGVNGEGLLRVFDLAMGATVFERPLRSVVTDVVPVGEVKPNGRQRVLVGRQTGEIALVDLDTGALTPLDAPHPTHWPDHGRVTALAVSPDGERAVTAGWDARLRVWDLVRGKLLAPTDDQATSVTQIAISDGGLVATVACDGFLRLWDGATGERKATTYAHMGQLWSVGLSRDGTTIFTGGWSGQVGVLDAASQTWRSRAAATQVFAVGLSADGKLALSQGREGHTAVWDVAAQKQLPGLPGTALWLRRLAVLSNGHAVVPLDRDTTALYDVVTQKRLRVFKGHTYELMDLNVSRDERRLATCANDRTARVFCLDGETSGEVGPLVTFTGHTAKVTGVALSPDGRLGVSVSDDRTLRVWDAATGRELDRLDFTPLGDRGGSLAFSADGSWFVVGTDRGYVLRVDLRGL